MRKYSAPALLLFSLSFLFCQVNAQDQDMQIKKFFDDHQFQWHDMNIPTVDSRILFDLVIQNKYTKALEIGGCYTVHNITVPQRCFGMQRGSREFYDYVTGLPNYKTTINGAGNGLCISYKKSGTQNSSSADRMPEQKVTK